MTTRFTFGWDGERHKGRAYGTLWGRYSDVDGDVTLRIDFDDLDPIARLDLLSDWRGLINREYEEQHKRCFKASPADSA